MSLKYPLSPARWAVLQALAGATVPLDHRQLSRRTGVTITNVRDTMIRPVKSGWVTRTTEPVPDGPPGRKYRFHYAITDLGREQLADYLKGLDA